MLFVGFVFEVCVTCCLCVIGCCLLFVACCLLDVVCCSLVAGRRSLCVV